MPYIQSGTGTGGWVFLPYPKSEVAFFKIGVKWTMDTKCSKVYQSPFACNMYMTHR